MQVKMRGNKIGVQKLGKASKPNSYIAMPEVVDSLGVIRYLGDNAPEDLELGMKVYYGTKRQQIRMGDADIEVMEEDNIYAVVEERSIESTQESAQAVSSN